METFVYFHTHWDREWYWPMRMYQVRLAEVVDEILDRLENNVFACFMLDGQTVVLEDYLQLRPENRDRLARLIQSGRLTIGPWYVMPDEFLVGGEGLVRNLKRGIEMSRAWGCHEFTGYLPDTFGHSADMPMILKQCGLDSAIVWRGVNPPKSLFRWQATNGEEILTYHLTEGYFQMMLHDKELTDMQRTEQVKQAAQKFADKAVNGRTLLPIGADHLGPITEHGHELLASALPDRAEITPEKFLAPYIADPPKNLPVIAGELTDNATSFILPGVYSSRLYLKKAMRQLEHQLTRVVEPMLALAKLTEPGMRYPAAELDLAWQTLILNQPHDSICGCSVDAVHRENEVRFEQVRELCRALRDRAEDILSQAAGPDQWVAFNLLDKPLSGVVEAIERVDSADTPTRLTQVKEEETLLLDDYHVNTQDLPLSHLTLIERRGWCWAEDVPAMGWKAIDAPSRQHPVVAVTDGQLPTMAHEGLSVEVAGDGTLTVTDKHTGKQYSGLHQLWDQPEQGDSYNSAPVPGTQPTKGRFRQARILHKGPLVGAIQLTYESNGMTVETVVTLKAGCQRLEFETSFTNQTPDHKLQVGFSTGAPVETVHAESHYSVVERRYDPDYREIDHMPVARNKELKTNTGPIQRFLFANGHSLITEGLTEYEVKGDTLLLTLLRAFGYLSKGDTGVRGAQAGPPFATPEGQCINRPERFRYSWRVTPERPEQLHRMSDAFYGTAFLRQGQADSPEKTSSYSLVSWDNPAMIRTACHWEPAENGLVLRLANTADRAERVNVNTGFEYGELVKTNFLLEAPHALSDTRFILQPGEVATLVFKNARIR